MEAISDDNLLLLVDKSKASILQINLKNHESNFYKVENEESRTVRDIEIYKNYLCVLYDKNEVIVYDVQT